MSTRTYYRVLHETHYQYAHPIALSQQFMHLTPRSFAYQQCLSHHITIDPVSRDWINRIDYFGNATKSATLVKPHKSLLVTAGAIVALSARRKLAEIAGSMSWDSLRARLASSAETDSLEPYQFLYESPHITCSADLAAYAAASFTPGRPLLEATLDLTERIWREFEFDDSATTISTPVSEVLIGRRGVCQDFAHLMIACLRTLGLSARYVSGYLLTKPPAGQPRLAGADASHAWVSVYCPGFGWVDFDPTNHCLVQNEHITLGWGRDFSDVTPMRGIVLGGGEQELKVKVTVTPLSENAAKLAAKVSR